MANVKSATVSLVSSLSLTVKGRTFHRGKPQLITNVAEIAYFEAQVGVFQVEKHYEPETATKKGKPVAAPAKVAKPVVEVEEDDEDEDEEEGEDSEDEDSEESEDDEDEDLDVGDDEAVETSEEEEAVKTYTKIDLNKLNKQKLMTLAKEELGVTLDGNANKDTMISMILKAQIAKLKTE